MSILSKKRLILQQYTSKTKLSCYTPHRRSTTVSLETYPLLYVDFVQKKIESPAIHQFSSSDVRMLLLTGKITKARKVGSFFCLQDGRNSRLFFKLARQNSRMLTTFFRSELCPISSKKPKPGHFTLLYLCEGRLRNEQKLIMHLPSQ